ncbi:MAG: ATP-binding protein, partial [Bacilli bacterium]|nr:ATP-binding protein [Bacilli bacterium]
ETFEHLENSKSIDSPNYYIIIYNNNLANLRNDCDRAVRLLNNMGLASYQLDKNETYQFYLNYFKTEVNQDKKIKFHSLKEKTKYIEKNGKKYCVQTISELPYTVDNAWLASVSLIKGVNLVINFKNNPDLTKAIKRINKRIVNLGEMLLGKTTESERMEIETQTAAYQELLEELKFSKVQLHIVEIMLIYEYSKETQKEIASIVKNNIKAKLDPLSFRQMEVYINSFPHLPTKNIKWLQRDFPSSTFAGSFPFISDLFIDKYGDYIGNNSGPVFFDMWNNLNEKGGTRTNANIMTIGASGKGKSYLQKILIKNQLLRDDKVFILDPENEYQYIAMMFGGNIIDVSGGEIRINPFEIFPELDEDGKTTRTFGALSKHLAFLSDFFKVVMPDLSPFTRQVLQNKVTMLYNEKGIYAYGYKANKNDKKYIELSKLKSSDFPTFDDLIKYLGDINIDKLGTQEQEAIVELNAFLQDFEKEGRFGSIWNGPT